MFKKRRKECSDIKEVPRTNKECTNKYPDAFSLPSLNDVKRTQSCRQLFLKGSFEWAVITKPTIGVSWR